MRCNICDQDLNEKEIVYNEDLPGFEPCTVCLDVIMETAYGPTRSDEDDEFVVLDADFDEENRSWGTALSPDDDGSTDD